MTQEQMKFPFATHCKDPISVIEAEEESAASGMRGKQMREVFELVKKCPGRTSLELSKQSDMGRHQIARRLSDLEQNKMVIRGMVRNCLIGKVKATTWHAREESEHGK